MVRRRVAKGTSRTAAPAAINQTSARTARIRSRGASPSALPIDLRLGDRNQSP